MKAKRIFIFAMCLMMAFAAVSCGGTEANGGGSDSLQYASFVFLRRLTGTAAGAK